MPKLLPQKFPRTMRAERVQGAMPGAVKAQADPGKEYVGGYPGYSGLGYSWGLSGGLFSLSQAPDDLSAEWGPRVWDAMMTDPACRSSVDMLVQGVVSGGVRLTPSHQMRPSLPGDATFSAGAASGLTRAKKSDPVKVDTAREIHAFCDRVLRRMDRPADDLLKEMLTTGYVTGTCAAEKVYATVESGKDAGLTGFKAIKTKPRDAWAFVVDAFGNVAGILAYYVYAAVGDGYPVTPDAPALGGRAFLPRDKFVVFAWDRREGDPRGRSVLRAAYNAWNFKTQTYPLMYGYARLFAQPKWDYMLPETAEDGPGYDQYGKPDPTKPRISAAYSAGQAVAAMNENGYIVRPFGSDLRAVQAAGDGRAHREQMDHYNREIVLAVLGTPRGTLEAQKGSKADSETGQDRVGLNIKVGKHLACRMVQHEILRPLIAENFGEEIAEEFTPDVSLGDTEHQDRTGLLQAASAAGYRMSDDQMPDMDDVLMVPRRDAAAWAAQCEHQRAMEAAQAKAKIVGPPNTPKTGDPSEKQT